MNSAIQRTVFRTILMTLGHLLRRTSKKSASFRAEAARFNCVAQIKLKDDSVGRWYRFADGQVTSHGGVHPNFDVALVFRTVDVALKFMQPTPDRGYIVHAAKNFLVEVRGADERVVWLMQLLNRLQTDKLRFGHDRPDGSRRYTTLTNGGPLHVDVKDGRILRMIPIDLTEADAPSWTIEARGRRFTPRRQATVAPHALAMKSAVYSDKRLLYPMKRVDFDPAGERNPQNRGISGYERISWDEALGIVSKEINRQKREHGPGSITFPLSSHHQWGNVGYYLSSLMRFANMIGFTRVMANPDSWEGWYWGAMHHFGNSQRVGVAGNYSTVEDCLRETEMIVFWSSDPESTNGAYQGFEGTQRRLWAKQLGIEFVHIDPHFNPTAQLLGGKWIPIKPTTDPALAIAIMYVWIAEDLYDKEYVSSRTTGFDEWSRYVMGVEDGIAKTPEWQEAETGIAAKDVRALARAWGRKKTYLSPGMLGSGFGGACRSATGTQWARCMVLMIAMQGWGKPGINMGNLQAGTPVDHAFYFPGYAEGGISGDLNWTGNAVNNYQRMPHVLTLNHVKQMVPRQRLPEAIIDGKATGYAWDGMSQEAQFAPFTYPMPGYSPIHMIYRYGGSAFSTIARSGRFMEYYRHPSIECVVNQSIWFEGEATFADIILPACTSFERWDIGEWSNGGGYVHHGTNGLNHRIMALQNKCIEPLGESKSDYRIFTELLQRLGLGAIFTEGCSELDWCQRIFESSDLPDHISWKKFVRKGYFVVPADPVALREPVNMRWFAEDRRKDIPEPHPLPSQYAEEFGKGLQTPSGKFEFVATTIQRGDPNNPERPALNRYIRAWEGPGTKDLVDKYPLQLLTNHSRYSFHTSVDGKSNIQGIEDHRVLVDGHYYWVLRLNSQDAADRNIAHHDLVKVFNARGAVICAADVTPLIARGVTKSFESSAEFKMIIVDGERLEIGGCMNVLTPGRVQVRNTEGMGSNSCLVQVSKWHNRNAVKMARPA